MSKDVMVLDVATVAYMDYIQRASLTQYNRWREWWFSTCQTAALRATYNQVEQLLDSCLEES